MDECPYCKHRPTKKPAPKRKPDMKIYHAGELTETMNREEARGMLSETGQLVLTNRRKKAELEKDERIKERREKEIRISEAILGRLDAGCEKVLTAMMIAMEKID